MEDPIFTGLPDSLQMSARHLLEQCGVNNVAWCRADTLMVLESIGAMQTAVLGGDVYQCSSGRFSLTLDNWYCERQQDEPYEEFASRSRNFARDYVARYAVPHNPSPWFALVFSA
jgi:hypothetical protein